MFGTNWKSVWLTDGGGVFDIHRSKANANTPQKPPPKITIPTIHAVKHERLVFSEEFIGANEEPPIEPTDTRPGTYNYLIGNDPERWHTGIHGYDGVLYHNVWEGVDFRLGRNGQDIEEEFIVRLGGDPTRVQVAYRGVKSLALADDGSLVIRTAFGELRELRPRVYQEIAGERVALEGRFKSIGKAAYTFLVEQFDKRYALFIDPTLLYSTFLGGSAGAGSRPFNCANSDWIMHSCIQSISAEGFFARGDAVVVDPSGAAVVAGEAGPGFPTTFNGYQQLCYTSGYGSGAFLSKLTATGDGLILRAPYRGVPWQS